MFPSSQNTDFLKTWSLLLMARINLFAIQQGVIATLTAIYTPSQNHSSSPTSTDAGCSAVAQAPPLAGAIATFHPSFAVQATNLPQAPKTQVITVSTQQCQPSILQKMDGAQFIPMRTEGVLICLCRTPLAYNFATQL